VYEVRKKSGSAFLSAFNFFVFFDKKLIPMKTILLFSLLFTFSALHAQSNLSIFNNNGQSFYVVLNGIRQNSKPETNVQVAQIKNGSYAVKVIFADGKTPDIDKNFMIDAPYDITARIIFKKGKGKLQLMGQEPTHGVIQEAVVYRPTDAAVYSDAVVVNSFSNQNAAATQITQTLPVQTSTTIQTTPTSSSTATQTTVTGNAMGINMNVNVQETPNATIQTSNTNTTTTTTTTTGTIPDENVNLNMNLSVGGVNVNLNANTSATGSGTGLGTGVSVTETTTSSSTTSTTASSSSVLTSTTGSNGNANQGNNQVSTNIQMNGNSQVAQSQQNQQNVQQQQVISQVQQAPLSNRVNCTKTMNRLEAFKVELQDQSFEEDRLEALQLAMKSTCLTTAQAEQLIDLFTFDENRLEVAKYLSDRLTDRDNAGALAKKLTFDSSKMEYRRYISE
jgi:hypothetical protein